MNRIEISARAAAWLALLRPANSLTAAADVIAGYALAIAVGPVAAGHVGQGLVLALAGIFLYAGGISLNDVCDAELDAHERPERPIPRGVIGRPLAAAVATGLLALGTGLAAVADLVAPVPSASTFAALAVVAFVLVYNLWAKPDPWFGPAAMAACRGFNLLVGLSAVLASFVDFWWIALLPAMHVFCVTRVSRAEVTGGGRTAPLALATSIVLVSLALLVIGDVHPVWIGVVLFAGVSLPPAIRASVDPVPTRVRKAVGLGVLSLVPLDAAIALLHGEPWWGIAVLALLPVSIVLGRAFSVT